MADREKHIRQFQRAAQQRLTTSEFLLKNGFFLDAVYLAGYVVECDLKALILHWTPRGQISAMLKKMTEVGARGHDFEYLKGLLKEQRQGKNKRDRAVLGTLTAHLKVVASWSTNLRYQMGTVDPRDAQQFFEAANAIHDTCTRG